LKKIQKNKPLSDRRFYATFKSPLTAHELCELYEGSGTGKGGNSAVYLATPSQTDEPECIVKFCRFPVFPLSRSHKKRIKRFKHEVDALKKALSSESSDGVIALLGAGKLKLPVYGKKDQTVEVAYYVMERADCDLASYIYQNSISLETKIKLFVELAQSISELHKLGIRHRDLKPDNVLVCDGKIKLGDLGLVHDVNRDYTIDGITEKIGPFGYMSPEAMNKAFADHSRVADPDTLVICEKSDIYQLGLILFFLVQGEIPMGCLESADFSKDWSQIPEAITAVTCMLQFRKERRKPLGNTLQSFA